MKLLHTRIHVRTYVRVLCSVGVHSMYMLPTRFFLRKVQYCTFPFLRVQYNTLLNYFAFALVKSTVSGIPYCRISAFGSTVSRS